MVTTKEYDYLNRLTQISSAPSASYTPPLIYNYNYNPANQRTKDTLADGTYWVYGYDSLGQVTNGCKFFGNGKPVPGQQFDYTFDTIGNRTQTMSGGDTNGSNLRIANYYANNLNQLTNRDVPPYVDVMGASILTNTVTINGQTAYRNQEYFRQQVPATNTNSPIWTNIIVSVGQSITGSLYVAQEPERFSYDADGNLTNDGRWQYVWDGENRLVQMIVNTNVGPQYKVSFAYDPLGRRIQKIVATNAFDIYTNNFLYDGWNLIATLSPSSSVINSFMWGNDLSGSMQDAGGVGGLLEVSYYGASTTNCFPAYDGNGNISALINASDGSLAANYEYGPFGEVIRATGPMTKLNPFRFSTKYQDDESDLLYYGYRYLNTSTGRWPNKDPMGEAGGINLYGFVRNNPVNQIDILGEQRFEDMVAERDRLDAIARQKKCCCGQKTSLSASWQGQPSGATISYTINTQKSGCTDSITILDYWWWDCFTAQSEGNAWKDGWFGGDPNAWQDYGWNSGGQSKTLTHAGNYYPIWSTYFDSSHWNWQAKVIYEYCGQDGTKHVSMSSVGPQEWTWGAQSKSWGNPD